MSLASEWLAAERQALAEALTERHSAHDPALARFGPRGRQRCYEDALHHLDYLTEAVRTRRSVLFTEYVAWAKVLLTQLGIPPEDLRKNLELL